MSFETNKFCVVKKKQLEKGTFNVECNIANESEIDKILSVCHTAQAENVEILNGTVNYSGNIDLCILFSTIDGEIGTINSSCPFTSRFEDVSICVGDKVGIKIEVEDYSIDSVSGSNIKINCTCFQSGMLICNREINRISTGDENMCMKEDEMLVNTLVGEAKEVFSIESEYAIKEPIKKIVMTDSQATIKNVESGVNFVSVSGEVVTRILYLTEKDRFESAYTTENFKEEVELEGVTREAISDAEVCVKKSLVKCEVDQDEKGVSVKFAIPVEVKVISYLEKTENIIKDIYSVCNELEVSTESFEMTKHYQTEVFESKIDGNLTLDDDKPRVDKIMFVGGSNLTVTNSYIKGEEVFVEGVVKTNVIYLNDETNSLHSVVVEVPFVVSDKASVQNESAIANVKAILYDVDVVVKKGREFYFDAKIRVEASYDCDEIGAIISNISFAGEYEEKDCAIELVLASQGETAWNIAKTVRVREETIMLQNPDVVFPLEKDENIIVYYQKRN